MNPRYIRLFHVILYCVLCRGFYFSGFSSVNSFKIHKSLSLLFCPEKSTANRRVEPDSKRLPEKPSTLEPKELKDNLLVAKDDGEKDFYFHYSVRILSPNSEIDVENCVHALQEE